MKCSCKRLHFIPLLLISSSHRFSSILGSSIPMGHLLPLLSLFLRYDVLLIICMFCNALTHHAGVSMSVRFSTSYDSGRPALSQRLASLDNIATCIQARDFTRSKQCYS